MYMHMLQINKNKKCQLLSEREVSRNVDADLDRFIVNFVILGVLSLFIINNSLSMMVLLQFVCIV